MATVKLVPIKSLKPAKHNPASRTANINGLARSIEEVGLLDPIKITPENDIIDGHRRVAAYTKLGLAQIEAIVLKCAPATAYAHLGGQSKKLTGNESLHVYLDNPNAVAAVVSARFAEAEETVGRATLQRMAKEGLSLSTYRLACRIAELTDRATTENVVKALRWLMHFNNYSIAQKAVQGGIAPGVIWAAVERNRPIKVRYDVAK